MGRIKQLGLYGVGGLGQMGLSIQLAKNLSGWIRGPAFSMVKKRAAQAEQFKEAFKQLLNASCELYLNLRGRPQNSSFKLSDLPSDLPILREEKWSYEALRLLQSKASTTYSSANTQTSLFPRGLCLRWWGKSSPGPAEATACIFGREASIELTLYSKTKSPKAGIISPVTPALSQSPALRTWLPQVSWEEVTKQENTWDCWENKNMFRPQTR